MWRPLGPEETSRREVTSHQNISCLNSYLLIRGDGTEDRSCNINHFFIISLVSHLVGFRASDSSVQSEPEHQVWRFLRAEEEFWVWIKLNLVLFICSENTLLESSDQSQEVETESNHRRRTGSRWCYHGNQMKRFIIFSIQTEDNTPTSNQSESSTGRLRPRRWWPQDVCQTKLFSPWINMWNQN